MSDLCNFFSKPNITNSIKLGSIERLQHAVGTREFANT